MRIIGQKYSSLQIGLIFGPVQSSQLSAHTRGGHAAAHATLNGDKNPPFGPGPSTTHRTRHRGGTTFSGLARLAWGKVWVPHSRLGRAACSGGRVAPVMPPPSHLYPTGSTLVYYSLQWQCSLSAGTSDASTSTAGASVRQHQWAHWHQRDWLARAFQVGRLEAYRDV